MHVNGYVNHHTPHPYHSTAYTQRPKVSRSELTAACNLLVSLSGLASLRMHLHMQLCTTQISSLLHVP